MAEASLFGLLALALCSVIAKSQTSGYCLQGWSYFGDSCYGFGEDSVTWADAQEMCELYNAKLAEVETSDENEFIKNLARQRKAPNTWLGGTDVFSEGYWVWARSKKPMYDFMDWSPGEPNHASDAGGQDCLQMLDDRDYQWNDKDCNTLSYFVCEAEVNGAVEIG